MIDVNGPVFTTVHAGLVPHTAWRAFGSMCHTREVPGLAGKPVSSPT
jgi:hypothetical protein